MRLTAETQFLVLLVFGFSYQHLRCNNATESPKVVKDKKSTLGYDATDENDGKGNIQISNTITVGGPAPAPKNKCNSKICPAGLIYHRSQNKDFCYTLLKPQPFPPQCPYPLFLSVTDSQVKDIYYQFKDRTIWLMATRNTEEGFEPFEWISKDYKHGFPVSYYTKTSHNIAEKNCLVSLNYHFRPVRCKDKHQALCIYPYDSASISKYCNKHYQNDNYLTCTGHGLNIENQNCYCESVRGSSRDSFCEALAEPLSRHQSDLLIHKFETVHDVCWIGLRVTECGIPSWTNSHVTLNYTCWSSDVDHSKSLGAVKFVEGGGWILADDDGTIQCGICELENVYDKNVSLHLKYNPASNSIEMRLKNPFEISDYFGGHYIFFCFAGPTVDKFKQKISRPFYDFEGNAPSVWMGHFANEWEFPVYYWCEGFQHPNLKPFRSNRVLACKGLGHEYSMKVKVRTQHNMDPYLDETHLTARSHILQKMGLEYRHELRAMKVINYSQKDSQMDIVFHLSTWGNQDEMFEYEYLQTLLRMSFKADSLVLATAHFRRSDVCLPSSTTDSNGMILHWPKTMIGASTLSLEICLQKNGNPVLRKCEGDFLQGGSWSKVIGKCTNLELSKKSKELSELLNKQNVTTHELGVTLSVITSDNQDITVVDIYLITEILEKMESLEDAINVTDVVNIFSNVMDFEPKELRKAQEMLNSTDRMLYCLDNILSKIEVNESNNHEVFSSKRVLVQVTDARRTNITGVAIKRNASDDFRSFELIPLYRNMTVKEILLDDTIELVAFLSDQVLREIEVCIPAERPIKLLMTLFSNDVLFNENVKLTRQTNSRILNILIPEFYCTFSTPISIAFKPIYITGFEKRCAFWKYGQDGILGKNIQGWWLEDGCPTINNSTNNNTYAICDFDHVTHFALLMMGSMDKGDGISETHVLVLDIITAIGTALSLCSILAMFIIAIAFKNWRQRSSNKILLNFSVAIALQMILLYVADNIHQDGIWCIMVGAALHYTVLSEFLWMLIIAYLQYRKFVTVFHQPTANIVGKACTICWCFPLIPIVLLLAISKQSYTNNPNGLCYPMDKSFYFAIVLPISLIVLINFIVFVRIIFAICRRKIESYGSKESDARLQVLLALFLFFLLGISWVFGIGLGFGGGIVFSYLFCLTATFQGLVMFLFFVVMNESSKTLWMGMRRILHLQPQRRRTSNSSYSHSQETEGTEGHSK